MKLSHILKALVCLLAVASLQSCFKKNSDPDASLRFNAASDKVVLQHEWRAAWLTTVNGSDWPDKNDSLQVQKTKLATMIRDLKAVGVNVVFIQVSSNQDAIYPSEILPWSHVLTGKQGRDPLYDPLALAVETCRAEGLQIHAWLNPFRCGKKDFERDPRHVVLSHPEYLQEYGVNYYLDPSLDGVKSHLASVVEELLTNYDLDGIHIDDYFYPDGLSSEEKEWNDDASYDASGKALSKELWRFHNVDECIKILYETTHSVRPGAVFGVSPAGRLVNTRKLYADPTTWCAQGTVDYLVPQIYWQHGHKVADFKKVLDSWEEVVAKVPMFTGLASYRYGETGFEDLDEFRVQVEECREASYVKGHVWFPARSILTSEFRAFLLDGIYKYGSLPPTIGESPFPAPSAPRARVEGTVIKWDSVDDADGYAVYSLERTADTRTWTAHLLWKGPGTTYQANERTNYIVLSYKGKMISEVPQSVFVPSRRKLKE